MKKFTTKTRAIPAKADLTQVPCPFPQGNDDTQILDDSMEGHREQDLIRALQGVAPVYWKFAGDEFEYVIPEKRGRAAKIIIEWVLQDWQTRLNVVLNMKIVFGTSRRLTLKRWNPAMSRRIQSLPSEVRARFEELLLQRRWNCQLISI
jgi:hypothetical protein